MIYLGIYIIGYILTLLFLIGFGKRLGLDYDSPKTYVNQEDWDSNESAYTAFSFGWPIMWVFGTVWVCAKSLYWFTKFLMGRNE